MGVEGRARRTTDADTACLSAFAAADCPPTGVALVAVGGYGRRELAPYSDLDLVLVHDEDVPVGDWAVRLWYPLWDSGRPVDHAVRSLTGVVEQAGADLRVALGLLDVRPVAGDAELALRLRSAVLTRWRRDARARLGELHELGEARARRSGELAHVAVPDLKDSAGGLRDATVLKALAAAWLVDVPHTELERCRQALLDVRDLVHDAAGRATDRVVPELWPTLADELRLPDALAAQQHVRGLGRRLAHVSRLVWRRAEAVRRRPAPVGPRRPALRPIGEGVAVHDEEVVLTTDARPGRDPALLLRCAAEAAERGLVLAPHTAARLAREAPDLPDPWPASARHLLVRLLAAGPGLLAVWETLEETGALARLLPEWEAVRLLPHATPMHRYTVDRHLVETCVEAARLLRRVARPDLLVVAALLHDLGKAAPGDDHSRAGEPLARTVATRVGLAPADAELVGTLVRHHLLLGQLATTRDLDDPDTVEAVTARVRTIEQLSLLAALTEADARATGEQAWSRWRAGLVDELVSRAAAALSHRPATPAPPGGCPPAIPESVRRDPQRPWIGVEHHEDGSEVVVIARDRIGLLADAATMLAVGSAPVRAARAWTVDGLGVSVWQLAGIVPDAPVLRQRLEAIVAGEPGTAMPPAAPPAAGRPGPLVVVRPEASRRATVLEVRADDRPGTVATVCRALAALGLQVVSAHVDTIGPQAVDVFHVREPSGTALEQARAEAAEWEVRTALLRAATLEGRSTP